MNVNEQFEKRWIENGASGDVFELVGHIPPAVIKHVYCPTEASRISFKNECEILKKMEHKNIVTLIGTREIDDVTLGIVMEYCQRGPLHNVIFDPTIIYTMRTVICWSEQLFDALDYMFRTNQIVHQDIKPDNIFVTRDFQLKIGDFGFGKLNEKTRTSTFMRTDRYLSPPQFDESQEESEKTYVSHRNDVYSLGLVMWEIIERRRVLASYDDESGFDQWKFLRDVIHKRIIRLESPKCRPERIQEIVTRCTDFSLSSRPMAQEVLGLLREVLQENAFLTALDFPPRREEEQKILFRPIGFDGTQEMIPATETPVRSDN